MGHCLIKARIHPERKDYEKNKIICTLGPATDKEGIMEALIREGMDVARFNFSHGTHEEQKKRLEKLKRCADSLTVPLRHCLIQRDRRSVSDVLKIIRFLWRRDRNLPLSMMKQRERRNR